MDNKLTLDQIHDLSVQASLELPLEQLDGLQSQIAELDTKLKRGKAWLANALDLRFKERAAELRKAADKDFGTVHVEDDGYDIPCELGKKVEWSQSALAGVVLKLQEAGEKPREYIKTEYKVSETAYNAWPEHIRKLIEGARTVKPETAKYKLVRKEAE